MAWDKTDKNGVCLNWRIEGGLPIEWIKNLPTKKYRRRIIKNTISWERNKRNAGCCLLFSGFFVFVFADFYKQIIPSLLA